MTPDREGLGRTDMRDTNGANGGRGKKPAVLPGGEALFPSAGRGEENRVTRLSASGLAVLEACLGRDAVSIDELVRRSPRRQAVARASLSRTLRRLWRAGLVELLNDWGDTLTEYYAAIDNKLAAQERDPDAAFAVVLDAVRRGAPGFFPYTTAADWIEDQRRAAAKLKRSKPTRTVCLTAQGRELVERLISRRREVNRSEHIA